MSSCLSELSRRHLRKWCAGIPLDMGILLPATAPSPLGSCSRKVPPSAADTSKLLGPINLFFLKESGVSYRNTRPHTPDYLPRTDRRYFSTRTGLKFA